MAKIGLSLVYRIKKVITYTDKWANLVKRLTGQAPKYMYPHKLTHHQSFSFLQKGDLVLM